MKIAYFDIFSGISGDMTLGAFIHAGVPLESLQSELLKLTLDSYSITHRTLQRSMISATKIDVAITPELKTHTARYHRHHGQKHLIRHGEEEHHHRSYRDIIRLIESSALSEKTKSVSCEIFTTIGIAEATIHAKAL